MKRAFDVVVSAVLIAILSPLMMAIAAATAITAGFPILFRQKRPGLNGRIFTINKFRTMRPPRVGEVWSRNDGERMTTLGRWLRRTSMDELPELFNVLRGDMSLVGPRPLIVEYLDKYTAQQMRRHEVRPGMTGLAQVSGRESIPFSRRLELDVWYVDHRSFAMDFKILMRTFITVLTGHGVDVVGDALERVDDLGLAEDHQRFVVKPTDSLE